MTAAVTLATMGNGPAFSAAKTNGTQTVTANTYTKATFNFEEFDTNNNFSSSTFTPTVAGYYQITGTIGFSPGATTEALIVLYKNGSAFKYGADQTATVTYQLQLSALVYMNGTTDYLELYGYPGNSTGFSSNPATGYTGFQGFLARAA